MGVRFSFEDAAFFTKFGPVHYEEHLLPKFGEMSLDEINAKIVRAWITELDNADKLAPKSISTSGKSSS